jgi:hypothetical protein
VRSRKTYPWKRENKDEEIQSSVDDSEDYCRLKAKWAFLANTCERTPVCSEVEAAIEDETEEESQHEASSKDNEDERDVLEASPDEDATIEEEEGKLSEA